MEEADHRDQICFGSIYEKCPEQASYGQIVVASCRGLLGEWRGRTQQLKSSFLGGKKSLKCILQMSEFYGTDLCR